MIATRALACASAATMVSFVAGVLVSPRVAICIGLLAAWATFVLTDSDPERD